MALAGLPTTRLPGCLAAAPASYGGTAAFHASGHEYVEHEDTDLVFLEEDIATDSDISSGQEHVDDDFPMGDPHRVAQELF